MTLRRLDSDLRPKRKELPADQWVLYELLRHGVVNPRPRDRAFDASTRAMGYSAAITDRVWAITGGKGVLTQQAHGEFIVSSETICLPNTQWVLGEYF